MPELTWSDGLSVGIAEIDEQHQHFLGLLNGLYRAIRAGKGKAVLADLLTERPRTPAPTSRPRSS